ncbi:MAG TPA: hypothetical protein VK992_03465 [Candidatus Caenarcaniphilales bacterium]|nr:hypothetical protein [Candidatus Caenarcaniphilales bacterium]
MRESPGHREDLRVVLAEMLDDKPVIAGKMFGFPAFYAAGKLVACVYGTGVGLRLPPQEASRLGPAPAREFEPYGRRMRGWTFIEPVDADELRAEAAVLDAAIERAQRAAAS